MDIAFKFGPKKFYTDYINVTLFLSFFSLCIQQTFSVPSVIYFFIDIPIIVMLVKYIRKIKKVMTYKHTISLTILMYLIVTSVIIGIVINEIPIGNIVYGLYKYFRGFVFFFCVLALADENSIMQTFKIFKIVFIINAVMTIFEFLVLNVKQDALGGVFGIVIGVNQYTNLFFVIISVYLIVELFSARQRGISKKYIAILFIMLIIAAIAEIKYFFAEIIVLCIVAYFCTKKNAKSIGFIVLISIGVVACYNMLLRMFPEFSTLISQLVTGGFERLVDMQRHYSTDIDIGRAVVFSYSNTYFLKNSISRLFGLGIGSITSSGFVDNSFWMANQETHYDQFYTAYLYNEQGIIGFVLYVLFYVLLMLAGMRTLIIPRKAKYGTLLIMMVLGCLMIFIYNMAMFSQLSFIAFWALAVLLKKCIERN